MKHFYTPKSRPRLPKLAVPKWGKGGKSGLMFKAPTFLKRLPVKKILVILLGVLLIGGIFVYLVVLRPLLAVYGATNDLRVQARKVKDGLIEQDFTMVEDGLEDLETGVAKFESVYQRNMPRLKWVPRLGAFVDDGQHLINAAKAGVELGKGAVTLFEPFAADLGFKDGGGERQELDNKARIFALLRLMPEIAPEFRELLGGLTVIESELAEVDLTKYPEELRGRKIKEPLQQAVVTVSDLASKKDDLIRAFEILPDFLGLDEPRTYAVFMANNYELRMTGGFNTYLVVITIAEGTPEVIYSIDTYDIDRDKSWLVYKNPPYYLRDFLRVDRFYARDATSTSPDFPTSVDEFFRLFWRRDWSLPQQLDGVIQVNNNVVEDILSVTGPVDAGGYSVLTDQGTYVGVPVKEFTSDNVVYELERLAGGALEEVIQRKDIIRYLMTSILDKAFNTTAADLGGLAQTVFNSLNQKDILIYSFDEETQAVWEALGYGGKITAEIPAEADYLHINNSNFGAGKRDWLIERSVVKEAYLEGGKKIGEIKMTTKNPASPDWWEWFPFYNSYFRFYVPAGSKMISLIASDGQEIYPKEYDDLGKVVLEGFFKMPEDSTVTITARYELPETINLENYRLIIQKQPGTKADDYEIKVGDKSKTLELLTDTQLVL